MPEGEEGEQDLVDTVQVRTAAISRLEGVALIDAVLERRDT
jgi:hypothetical protein